MGALMREMPWRVHVPASHADWAPELQVAVSLMLNSKFPMFLLWGAERACLYNDGYIPILGKRHPAALGMPYRDVWPEIWDQIDPLIQRATSGEAVFFDSLPLTVERYGHSERAYFTFSYSPLYDSQGDIKGMVCICMEATDQVAAMEDLQSNREALHKANAALERRVTQEQRARDRVWRLSRDIIAVASLDGRFRDVNPAFEALLGWTEAEAPTLFLTDIAHPDDARLVADMLSELRAGRTVSQVQFRNRERSGGHRWISWSVVPEGDRLSMIGRDVTADREQRRALADAEDQLRQAQKMEAVGQLTGGIAHDFNNLLTGIIGSLDMMRRRAAQGRPVDVERFATAAMTSANRAAALTHRLLAFSRRQSLDPRAVDVDELVRGMEEMFRRTLGPAIALETVAAGGLWLTHCDPNQLESALLNLVINARDAMPDGGRLTIETSNAHLDEVYAAQARDVRPGQYVCLAVTDTGTGMTTDIVSKAFDPFFTTKPIGQGTGLGLSMIYGFTRQSDGAVKIYSEVGRGTTVKLYLPRHYGPTDKDGRGRASNKPQAAGTDRIVLVVEDETTVRDLVIDVLDDLGFRVLEAHDGPSGLRIVQSDVRIDLLVSDVGLPGFNGRQLADAARLLRPGLKVLFMTGYAHNAAVGNGLLEPGMQVITKPFAIDSLSDRIATIMREE
jgi:PAS domain S-box-containing protein